MKGLLCFLGLFAIPAVGAELQLPYASVSDRELGLPVDFPPPATTPLLPAVAGRRVPALVSFTNLSAAGLPEQAVPLPLANTRAHLNFQQRRFGRLDTGQGNVLLFNHDHR